MSRVYIRRSLLTVAPRGRDSSGPHLAPDAAQAVGALTACEWDVVVIGRPGTWRERLENVRWADSVKRRDEGAWLLTDDVADDRWARLLGLRTALVGPHHDLQSRPERCDVEFRDLHTAALEILAANGQRPGAQRA